MMVLFWLMLAVFIVVCVLLCFLVLIQSDKGGGISGAIGGGLGGANSLLGTQDTANILTKGSMIFGAAFLILCVLMSMIMSHQTITVEKSILQKRAEKQQTYSPSSVLNKGGMQIKQSAATQGSQAAAQAGLPVKQAPEASAPAGNAAATTTPKALPKGALPLAPPSGGPEK